VFELIWRDYFRFYGVQHGDRLFHLGGPQQKDKAWVEDADRFWAWAEGRTGVPLCDANMVELNETGFMSNRGRQNVASFLAQNLQHDWRAGAAYLERMLADYDVTSNWGNWTYVAGVGPDPRDRYFHLAFQTRKYDEQAAYIKHWLPELAPLPAPLAREPYRMTAMDQQMHGVTLGEDYPAPVVDLEASYERLRAARR
jgi:deoxyribodipyrimidine photo-lyase